MHTPLIRFNREGTNRVGHDGRPAIPASTRHHPPGHQNPERADRRLLERQTVRLQFRHRREQLDQAGANAVYYCSFMSFSWQALTSVNEHWLVEPWHFASPQRFDSTTVACLVALKEPMYSVRGAPPARIASQQLLLEFISTV